MAKFSVRPRPHMADAALHFSLFRRTPVLDALPICSGECIAGLIHYPAQSRECSLSGAIARSRRATLARELGGLVPLRLWALTAGIYESSVAVCVCATATVEATAKTEAIARSR